MFVLPSLPVSRASFKFHPFPVLILVLQTACMLNLWLFLQNDRLLHNTSRPSRPFCIANSSEMPGFMIIPMKSWCNLIGTNPWLQAAWNLSIVWKTFESLCLKEKLLHETTFDWAGFLIARPTVHCLMSSVSFILLLSSKFLPSSTFLLSKASITFPERLKIVETVPKVSHSNTTVV